MQYRFRHSLVARLRSFWGPDFTLNRAPSRLAFYPGLAGLLFLLLLGWAVDGQAHIEKGTMPDSVAEMEYRILLDFEPDNQEIRNRLGMVLVRKNQFAEAEQLFKQVLAGEPANYDAMEGLGQLYLKTEAYPAAIEWLTKAIALDPHSGSLFTLLGRTYMKTGALAEAAKAFANASRQIEALPPAEAEPRRQELELLLAELAKLKAAGQPVSSPE